MAAPRTTIPELPEQTVATETDLFVVQSGPTTKHMAVGRLMTFNTQALIDHITDPVAAHPASAISAVPAGPPFSGADVQTQLSQGAGAINQLSTAINDHLAAVTDAHDASMISVAPVGNLASINVQAALVELQTTIDDLPVEPGGEGLTTEAAIDAVAAALVAGNNVDITYNDSANTITVDVEPLTALDVGLGNVNNTSDLTKPVSAPTQAALDLKVDKSSTTAWTAVTFTNGWANFGTGYATCQYRKVGDTVQLRGMMKSGTIGLVPAFTLPAGFRPPAHLSYVGSTAGSVAFFDVMSDGQVNPWQGSNEWLSINCQFSVSA